jgi:hypothetical protein
MLSFDRTQHALAFWLAPVICYFLYSWLKVIYGAFFGPLSKLPGPKLWAISRLPRMYMEWQGEEAAGVDALHKKYGPIVRLAPNEVSFAGGAQAWVRLCARVYSLHKANVVNLLLGSTERYLWLQEERRPREASLSFPSVLLDSGQRSPEHDPSPP